MNRHSRALYSWLFIVFVALLCSACGSDDQDSSTSTTTYLRLVNATKVNDLQLTVDSSTTSSDVDVGAAGSYASLTSGTYSVIVSDANGVLSTSSTSSLAFTADVYYTVVAYTRGGQIKLLSISDNKTTPATGFASVTVANAGSDAGALDVYLLAPGGSITTDLSPTFSNVTAAGTSLTNSVTAGTYDIVVTGYNKPSDVRLTMSSVTLSSTQILTLALTPTSGGALVDGALIEQKGSASLRPANKARVRVVAAFPAIGSSNSTIATTVGGTTLSAVTAPSIGTYTLVPADSTSYAISVDGTPATSLPATTFTSGGDYTLLVHGTDAASPSISVLIDNNQLPSSGAKIRLINGAVATGGISLNANYVPLFSELAYGSASDYSGTTAGSTLLQLTSPVLAFTSYSATVTIQSGGVYSLFVLGSTSNAIEILSKDK